MGRNSLKDDVMKTYPIELYLEEGILSFHPELGDAADTDYLQGYLEALVEIDKLIKEGIILLDKMPNT